MPIRAALLETTETPCVYLAGKHALCEEFIVQEIDEALFSTLIENGYRHFGRFFFRPCCLSCRACVPIRIPAIEYPFPRSARKLFQRNAGLTVEVTVPEPSPEAFRLYLAHKQRFADSPAAGLEPSYERFVESFFHPFPFSFALQVWDGNRLVAISHFDLTERVLSDVYCYYDLDYLSRSLGRFAIYKLIEFAAGRGVPYVYLGFYIQENAHMTYKRDIRPNEVLLTEGMWTDFMDAQNQQTLPAELAEIGFTPRFRLGASANHDSGDS